MSKVLGDIKAATIMLDNVMKCEKMEYRAICLLTGKNGSGKTLVMKNLWCINIIAIYVIRAASAKSDIKEYTQFVYTNTFDDCDFTGYVEGFFEGCELRIDFDKGVVTKIDHNFPNNLEPPAMPIYMSGQTRTFDTFIKYMKYKKALGISTGMVAFTPEELGKILSTYKLYDMLFIEVQLVKLNGKVISDELKKDLKDNYQILADFDQLLVDTDECTMVNYERDKKIATPITRYSAGEQSLLNMLLAAS